MNANTQSLKPAKYRAWIDYCAAQGINPLPEHSVTDNGCWTLVKPLAPMLSGHIQIKRRVDGAQLQMQLHTLSYLYANDTPELWRAIDDIQADGGRAVVRHKPICHEPNSAGRACFNPAHLALGTQADNMRDRVREGRHNHGEAHGRTKLTAAQVDAIRQESDNGVSQRALGRKYGVSSSTIGSIVRRETWSNSDGRLF